MLMLQLPARTCFFFKALLYFQIMSLTPKLVIMKYLTQLQVAQPIVDSSVSGFDGTIFAYGQTS